MPSPHKRAGQALRRLRNKTGLTMRDVFAMTSVRSKALAENVLSNPQVVYHQEFYDDHPPDLTAGSGVAVMRRHSYRCPSREREIVQLIAEGRSSKEVAVTLGLSLKTAETHRSNILRKLNLHSASELVLYAVRNNIIQVPRPLNA